jgi:hypothetical protein
VRLATLRIDGTRPVLAKPAFGSAPPSAGVPELVKQARATATTSLVWRRGRPLSELTNAHRTNTVAQMKAALAGPYSQLECDLRGALNPPHEVECRHDPGSEPGDNLTLVEWLRIGKASGRMLKLDVKDSSRLGDILTEAEASGVPAERFNINLGDAAMRAWGDEIRRRLPGATLSLNPRGAANGPLTAEQTKGLVDLARHLGAPSTFVLRYDQLTDANLKVLEAVAPVSVWNDPGMKGMDHPGQAAAELKRRGCTGVIDLRPSQSPVQKVEGLLTRAMSWARDFFSGL